MRYFSFFILYLYSILLSSAQIADTNSSIKIEPYKLNLNYIGMLSDRADFFLNAGNYEKAVNIGEEKTFLLRRIYGEDNVEYAISLTELAYYCYKKGEYEKAVELTTKALETLEKKGMGESVIYAIISNHFSVFLNQINERNIALQYKNNAISILNDILGDFSKELKGNDLPNIYSRYSEDKVSEVFMNAFNEYVYMQYDSIVYAVKLFEEEARPSIEIGDYSNAITTLKETLRILQKWAGDYYDKYTASLLLLSIYYEKSGNYEECYKICEKLVGLTKKYSGELSSEYAKSISNYAFCLYKGDEFNKAVEKEQKAIDISISVKDSLQYALSLSNMGIYHNKLGLMDKAIAYEKKALPILESFNQHDAYINTLSELSDLYCQNGDFENALLLADKAIGLVDFQSKEYYRLLANKASCYFYLKDYDTAINLLEEVYYKKIQQYNKDSLSLSQDLDNLALYYSKTWRLYDAIRCQEQSIEILKKLVGNENMKIANSLSFLSHLYVLTGDFCKGIQLGENAVQIIKKVKGENCIDYVYVLKDLSFAYGQNYEKRLSLLEEAKNIIDISGIGGSSLFVKIYKELAYCYAGIGVIDKVKEIERIIGDSESVQTLFKNRKQEYADYSHTLSECYMLLGDYKKSIEIDKGVLEYYKKEYGNDISKYDDKILNLLLSFANQKDTTNVLKLLKETGWLEYCKRLIKTNIEKLPFKLRKDLWTYLQKSFVDAIPLLAGAIEDDYLISCAYDISALFAKNILLKTDISLSKIIENIDDTQIKEDYNRYLSDRLKLGLTTDKNEEDSLIHLINNQEDILRQKLNNMGLLDFADYSWKDIQSKMKTSDLAIEFLCFDNGYGQFLSALLLKQEYNSPKLIKICPTDILKDYCQREQLDSLYLTIWEPIESELRNVKDVYFSPAGPIYNIPIEYLQNQEGVYMSERYNIFRVSSTKKIINNRITKSYNNSVLFGGLDYDYEKVEVQDIENNHHLSIDRGLRELLINRNGFDKLLNTEEELVEIRKLLSQSNISCLTYTGINGSEEAFKKLSGKSLDIIHMSTHGMFIETNMIKEQGIANIFPFVKDDYSPIQYENAALSRTFLVMSGGNMLSKHETIPEGMEDGILTAQEIAGLFFKGLDLVVLSACQTALGDIDNEGVYGLQRGFKKAGANTILMSLGKVDDEATKILIVEFYKNLMNGKTKHQSLKDAQKYLRQVDNGKYDKPEYWASFIMLDGIN